MIGDSTISPNEALKNAIWNGCKSFDRSLTNACIATNNTDASAIKITALVVRGNSLKRGLSFLNKFKVCLSNSQGEKFYNLFLLIIAISSNMVG